MSCFAEDQNSVLHELYAWEVIPLSYAGDYSSHRFAQQMLAWPVTTKKQYLSHHSGIAETLQKTANDTVELQNETWSYWYV